MNFQNNIRVLLLFTSLIFMFTNLSCELGDNEDSGYVNFKISIESNLDSLAVSFFDSHSLNEYNTTIRNFPWSYDYTDVYNSYGIWLMKTNNDSGYLNINFYSGDSNKNNFLKFRDSVTYFAPFSELKMRCGADEQINYNFSITTSDSMMFKLGYDAWWAAYEIDTLIINDWHFYEFQSLYHGYKGLVINPGNSNSSNYKFISSGKHGRVIKSYSIQPFDTIKFQVSQGQINILQ
jgi:hypothetical protein